MNLSARLASAALMAVLAVVLPGGAGCGSSESATGPDVTVDPIRIDSVDVLVQETEPPTASARVQGVIGDGCSTLHSVEQQRSAGSVTITILRQRPIDAICTQIARLYDRTIPLEGTFPPGRYVLQVNDVETSFTTE